MLIAIFHTSMDLDATPLPFYLYLGYNRLSLLVDVATIISTNRHNTTFIFYQHSYHLHALLPTSSITSLFPLMAQHYLDVALPSSVRGCGFDLSKNSMTIELWFLFHFLVCDS